MSFADLLDAADKLSPDEQETLIDILRHRLAERGRNRLVAEIHESRQQFAEGRCQPTTAEQIMAEILARDASGD